MPKTPNTFGGGLRGGVMRFPKPLATIGDLLLSWDRRGGREERGDGKGGEGNYPQSQGG